MEINRYAKQVSIGGLTAFLKQINWLKVNPYLKHRIVHARRKHSGSAKVREERPSNLFEDDIRSCWY